MCFTIILGLLCLPGPSVKSPAFPSQGNLSSLLFFSRFIAQCLISCRHRDRYHQGSKLDFTTWRCEESSPHLSCFTCFNLSGIKLLSPSSLTKLSASFCNGSTCPGNKLTHNTCTGSRTNKLHNQDNGRSLCTDFNDGGEGLTHHKGL